MFSLCLSVARIDAPPLQLVALAFVSNWFVLVRVREIWSPRLREPKKAVQLGKREDRVLNRKRIRAQVVGWAKSGLVLGGV